MANVPRQFTLPNGKHGHWIQGRCRTYMTRNNVQEWNCSVCGIASDYKSEICPVCGTIMDEKVEENHG